MLKLSKTIEYALMSINHINQCDEGGPIPVKKISIKHNIPFELLAKILQKLSKADILKAIQGPKGGYQLNDKYKNLTLIQLIEILEGPFGITDCLTDHNCEQISKCNIINPIEKINSQVYQVFNQIKINEIT